VDAHLPITDREKKREEGGGGGGVGAPTGFLYNYHLSSHTRVLVHTTLADHHFRPLTTIPLKSHLLRRWALSILWGAPFAAAHRHPTDWFKSSWFRPGLRIAAYPLPYRQLSFSPLPAQRHR